LAVAGVAMATLVLATTSANAAPVSIDFDNGGSIATGDTVLVGTPLNASGQMFTGQVGAWNAGTGTLTGGVATPQSFTTIEGPVFTVNPTGSAQTANFNASTFGSLGSPRNDYFWHDTQIIPWELTGLTPNGIYNITFFNGNDNSAPTSIDGVGFGTPDAEGDYDFMGVVADGSGEITGNWNDAAGRGSWSGLQFELQAAAAIPEPRSFALAGLGLLGLMGFRRRRRR